MLVIKSIRFLHLLSYLFITGQLMFYFFIMADALRKVGIENFVEQRKIVDPIVRQRHVPVYYVCLLLNIVLLAMTAGSWYSSLFVSSLIAFLCLVADICLAQRENIPINAAINMHSIGDPRISWEALRMQWLFFIRIRGAISLAGFLSLLAGIFWTEA